MTDECPAPDGPTNHIDQALLCLPPLLKAPSESEALKREKAFLGN
jgi:hypothetical protein